MAEKRVHDRELESVSDDDTDTNNSHEDLNAGGNNVTDHGKQVVSGEGWGIPWEKSPYF